MEVLALAILATTVLVANVSYWRSRRRMTASKRAAHDRRWWAVSEIIEYHDCGHAPPVITVRKPQPSSYFAAREY